MKKLLQERRRVLFAAALSIAMLTGATANAVAQAASTPPPPKVKVGDTAPDFTLRDQNGKDVSLHDFKGKKNIALAFYVFAFTGG